MNIYLPILHTSTCILHFPPGKSVKRDISSGRGRITPRFACRAKLEGFPDKVSVRPLSFQSQICAQKRDGFECACVGSGNRIWEARLSKDQSMVSLSFSVFPIIMMFSLLFYSMKEREREIETGLKRIC